MDKKRRKIRDIACCNMHGAFTGQYWLVIGGTGSVWGDTGCNLVVLGQYNLVMIGIEWYWGNKGLLCLYILKN